MFNVAEIHQSTCYRHFIQPSNKLCCTKCFKSTLPVLETVHWMFCRDVSMYLLAIFELCAQIPILMIGFAPWKSMEDEFPVRKAYFHVQGVSFREGIYIYPIPIFFVLHVAQYHFWCLNQILIASDKSILPRIWSTSQRVFRSTTWRIFEKPRMWRAAYSAYVSIWGFKIPVPCHASRKREKTRKLSKSCSLQPLTTTLYHNIL